MWTIRLLSIDLCSLAVGAEYKVFVYHGRIPITDVAPCCLTLRTHFLAARVFKEVVS